MLAVSSVSPLTLCLLAACVDLATSSFGRKFKFTIPTEKRQQFEGKAALYTYHETVEINRKDSFRFDGSAYPVFGHGNITLIRHRKIDIEIYFNMSLYLKHTSIHHVVHLEGDKEFGVSLLMLGPASIVAALTVLPNEYFGGEYIPYFFDYDQVLLVLFDVPHNESAMLSLIYYGQEQIMNTYINGERAESYAYPFPYMCSSLEQMAPYRGGFSRTAAGRASNIKRGKMVFYTGNCGAENRDDNGYLKCTASMDAMLDVALATHFAAKEFVAFKGAQNKPMLSYVVLMGLKNNTLVEVHSSFSEPMNFTVHTTTFQKVFLNESFQLITSSDVIQVYLLFTSSCLEGEMGGPSMTSLIPNALFLNHYMWSFPYNILTHIIDTNYIVVIRRANVDYGFVYNGDRNYQNLSRAWSWEAVAGTKKWLVGEFEITKIPDVCTLSSSTGGNFGLYIYGIEKKRAYLTYAGFVNTPINLEGQKCTKTDMVAGDQVDNDCDGLADEESSSLSDNDEDGVKGEDVTAPVPKMFDKDFKEAFTTPAMSNVNVIENPTTTQSVTPTAWRVNWEMTTESPKEETNYVFIIILLLFIIASILLLCYLLSQKKTENLSQGEITLSKAEREARIIRRSMELTRTDSKDRNWKSPHSAPGRTVSTYLH